MRVHFKYENATLEVLEPKKNVRTSFVSHLDAECYRLRHIQLRLLTIDNLRLLIRQDIGTRYLIPLALRHLRNNPLVEGDCYPGDLLCAVLCVNPVFWTENNASWAEVKSLAKKAYSLAIETGDNDVAKYILESLSKFPEKTKRPLG